MNTFIKAKDIKRENFYVDNNSLKINKIQGKENDSYFSLSLRYNFGTPEEVKGGNLNFQLEPCYIKIRKCVDDNTGKVSWKTTVVIKDKEELEGLKNLDNGIIDCISKFRTNLYLPENFTSSLEAYYRNIHFKMEEDKDGKAIITPMDMMCLQIDKDSIFEYVESIVNNTVNTRRIDYTKLEGKVFHCQIVFNVRYIYKVKKNKCFPQVYINNCIILDYLQNTRMVDQKNPEFIKTFYSDRDLDAFKEKLRSLEEEAKTKENSLLESAPSINTQNTMSSTMQSSLPATVVENSWNMPPTPSVPPMPQMVPNGNFSQFLPQEMNTPQMGFNGYSQYYQGGGARPKRV